MIRLKIGERDGDDVTDIAEASGKCGSSTRGANKIGSRLNAGFIVCSEFRVPGPEQKTRRSETQRIRRQDPTRFRVFLSYRKSNMRIWELTPVFTQTVACACIEQLPVGTPPQVSIFAMKMDMGASSPSEYEEPVRIDGEVNALRWGVFPVKMAKTKKFMTIQPAFCQRLHCAGSDRVPDGGRDGIAA